MTYLLVAIGTIIFYNIFMPIVDTFSVFLQSAINRKIHSWQLDMSLEEAETQAAAETISPTPSGSHNIGFEIPVEPDDSEVWCK